MDTTTKSVVFCGSVPLIVNGKRYEVQALPIAEIIGSDDFMTSGLHFPADGEPVNDWQAVHLEDEQYRNTLDKWLNRLVTLNGVPMSLELIAAHGWTDRDIGRFLTTVLQASGLTRKAKENAGEQTTPEQWVDILCEYQYIVHASWNELVGMPLLRLDATRERILKQWTQDMQSRMSLGGLGGGSTQSKISADYNKFFDDCRDNKPPTFKTRQEYEAYQARQSAGGITPKPMSRDEYFAMTNSLMGH